MNHHTGECQASLIADELCIGNSLITRRWRVQFGGLVPLSLRIVDREWLRATSVTGTLPPGAAGDAASPRLQVQRGQASAVEPPSLVAELTCGQIVWRLQIFPGVAAVTISLLAWPAQTSLAAAEVASREASGIETEQDTTSRVAPVGDCCERLALACHHAHLHTVILADRTDVHDNLATSQELRLSPSEPLAVRGCVFAIEDPLTGSGLVLLKHAPLPHARPYPGPVDLRTCHDDGRPVVLLHGHGAADGGAGLAWTLAAYSDGANGRIAALHAVQRCCRAYVPGRDGMLLSNTWGDRNRDGRISAEFMAREIAAGQALGVDVVQIDDGWQRGVTSNSLHGAKEGVWQGFWAADAQFWTPHPQRFPDGLTSTAAAARAAGLAFGLWFAPDSAQDFANWRKDADTVLGFWREHGVTQVKIDGVKAHRARGQQHLRDFFATVLADSHGAVTFDLDVTAEIRPGYFGAMAVGPLFVENRYTDWHRWWPHGTLRNLWQLAHWIDPVRLRMEFLNRNRHEAHYAGDPLAPAVYPADWLFASVMIASPLAWFEVSELPVVDADRLRPLIAVWKNQREALHGGRILPVGASPNGATHCGFHVLGDGGRRAYLIALREPCAPAEAVWRLPQHGHCAVTILAGAGSLMVEADGTARIRWQEAPGYLFAVMILDATGDPA